MVGRVPSARAAQSSRSFIVRREGSVIGRHRLAFAQQGEEIEVSIEIDLDVRLIGLLPLYRYRHGNTERWRDATLLSLDSRTDDNGTAHEVRVRRAGDALQIDADGAVQTVAGDLPSTSYWNRAAMRSGRFINSQTGALLSTGIETLGVERIETENGSLDAEHMVLTGELALDLWYRGQDWVKLAFTGPDGSRIDYSLEGEFTALAAR